MQKIVVCYSGGLDSTVLLAHLKDSGYTPEALCVDYGQRHRKEIERAEQICSLLGVALQPVLINSWAFEGSALTGDGDVPEGHYSDPSMKATVVPNRNAVLLSLAAARSIAIKSRRVAYAAHAGDRAVYPDCRPAFVEAMRGLLMVCDYEPVELWVPFRSCSKAEIVRRGVELGAPLELSWSCYKGGERHCGACGTCVARKEAFVQAGVSDPTEYAI